MFDFDSIDQWGPSLLSYLSAIVPKTAYAFLRDRRPKYFEECRDLLFRAPGVSPREIIAATGDWLRSQPELSEKMPNPIGDLLYSWAQWTIEREFSSADVGVDCGLRFDALVPPDWIVGHEIVDESTMVVT
jgi:hypothetical protein